MNNPNSAPESHTIVEQAICHVCHKGTLRRGKRLLMVTDSTLKCDCCGTEYHRTLTGWILRHVPAGSVWTVHEGEWLSDAEIQRIAQGGLSDKQVAAQVEAKRREDARLAEEQHQEQAREAEERRVRETPGTPQYYGAQFERIMGITDDKLQIANFWTTTKEARQHARRFTQTQKELRQLKREINSTVKEIHSIFRGHKANVQADGWTAFMFGSESEMATHQRALKRADLRQQETEVVARYTPILKFIDKAILIFDGLKVDIDRKLAAVAENPESEDIVDKHGHEAQGTSPAVKDSERPHQTVEQILGELDSLVGLDTVKHEFQEFVNLLQVQKMRRAKGLPVPPISLHVVFYGNPGTGKTTVAHLR